MAVRPTRDWPGMAAFILAASLGVGWAGALLISATPVTDPISKEGADLLSGIGQVLAGALATYLGTRVGEANGLRRKDDSEPSEE